MAVSRKVTADIHPGVLSVQDSQGKEESNERVVLRGIDDELVSHLILGYVLATWQRLVTKTVLKDCEYIPFLY